MLRTVPLAAAGVRLLVVKERVAAVCCCGVLLRWVKYELQVHIQSSTKSTYLFGSLLEGGNQMMKWDLR